MGDTTGISWCDHTMNWWIGCSKIAPECASCYAADYSNRYGKAVWGPQGTRTLTAPANRRRPLKWNREAEAAGVRRRVFCSSLADVFEDWSGPIHDHKGNQVFIDGDGAFTTVGTISEYPHQLPAATLEDVRHRAFRVIEATPWLEWLLLTKRPENIRRMWPKHPGAVPLYLHNVRLGTSAGCQPTADKAVMHLIHCRDLCASTFVSSEPMLDAVNFRDIGDTTAGIVGPDGKNYPLLRYDALSGTVDPGGENWGAIDQLIIGCESNGQRIGRLGTFKSESEWNAHAAELVAQCRDAGVAAFVKQIPLGGKLEHDVEKFPEGLRFQEFPDARTEATA